ncbi:MAG TPA: GNAT family N-acetyltransferase [Pyrinomonadaceae bacterium]|nr:GNAT family N-acetyltransferase [Pyrinomonadaceae bacterium]
MNVELREIDARNFRAVIALKVGAGQESFIAPNVTSIAQCYVYPHLIPKAIYAGENLVGFTLYSRDSETRAYWIVRFMIGAGWQGKGHGRASLAHLLEEIRRLPKCREILLSCVPSNLGARKLYESAGFLTTGETNEDGEIIMRYEVAGEAEPAAVSTANVP